MIPQPGRLMAGGVAALALILLLEWVWPGGGNAMAPESVLRLAQGSPKAPLIERAANQWAAIVLARPLLSASRRPPRVAAGPRGDTAPDEARLAGIMIGRFGRRAIFAPAGGGKPLVLAEGEPVNDSTIRSIQPDQVVLASGTVLRPEFDKNRVATAFTPSFQTPGPNISNGFVNGAAPQPNFAFPRMPFQPPQPVPGQPGATYGQPATVPIFRGPMNPNRRE
jgi:hypothetical protein